MPANGREAANGNCRIQDYGNRGARAPRIWRITRSVTFEMFEGFRAGEAAMERLAGRRTETADQLGVRAVAARTGDRPLTIQPRSRSAVWARGLAMAQSRSSQLAALALAPEPGERVLDLCAAPGAKATQLCALTANRADVTAVELHASRASALHALGRRMGARLNIVIGDAREVALSGKFDAVLVDAPCTGLGVLAARPDARWRRREDAVAPLATLQRELLARALELVAPGGRVVYSTCTLNAAENEDVVRASGGRVIDVANRFPALAHPRLPGALLALPHRFGSDGFFIAALERSST